MKNYFNFGIKCFVALSAVGLGLSMVQANMALAKTDCTILTKNLVLGSTNSTSEYQVTSLQKFLNESGYLSVPPTGRYGDMTVSAVKKFQSAQGISSVGAVGALTRAAIQKVSCVSVTATVQAPQVASIVNVPILPATTTSPVATPKPKYLVTSPSSGEELTIGQKYSIRWSGSEKQFGIHIILLDEHGIAAGYVAANVYGGTNQYEWTVGNISISGRGEAVVAPGKYQINIIDTVTYGSALNIKSKVFEIKEIPLRANRILPSNAVADDKTTVMINGRGFNSLTRVNLEGSYYSQVVTPQYISPDGTFVGFLLPQYLRSGLYNVSVYNDYSASDDSATSTPSNYLTLQVEQN